jgi:hypothetical protein
MLTVSPLLDVQVLPHLYVVGQTTPYTIKIIANSQVTNNNEFYIKAPPNEILTPSSPLCSSVASKLSPSLDCRSISTTEILVKIKFNDPTDSFLTGDEFRFEIESYRNPSSTRPSSNFEFSLLDSKGFPINNYLKAVTISMVQPADIVQKSV